MFRDKISNCLEYLLSSASVPSPCFVLDTERLLLNMRVMDEAQRRTGAKILLALKGFSAWSVFPLLSRDGSGPLWGTCASSVDEARLGREKFGGEVHAFAAAWSDEEIQELLGLADHISFNSAAQMGRHAGKIISYNKSSGAKPVSMGLRVNPEHSESSHPIYDPCARGSRLGVRRRDMPPPEAPILAPLEGLHFHALCEQDSPVLARTLRAFEDNFAPYFQNLKWFNFGGGHHITRDGYNMDLLCDELRAWRARYPGREIYLEPGEAVALDAGWLCASVLDIVEADMPALILDVSAACHMPDVLEMPYTPDLWLKSGGAIQKAAKPGREKITFRAAGKSCLAGDVIGEYSCPSMPKVGDRLVFGDMAIYSMVKTNTFNGLRLPSIAVHDFRLAQPLKILRQFGYEDFMGRLS